MPRGARPVRRGGAGGTLSCRRDSPRGAQRWTSSRPGRPPGSASTPSEDWALFGRGCRSTRASAGDPACTGLKRQDNEIISMHLSTQNIGNVGERKELK